MNTTIKLGIAAGIGMMLCGCGNDVVSDMDIVSGSATNRIELERVELK